jgi:predicted DNA-binding transcriptional regulator AlpA
MKLITIKDAAHKMSCSESYVWKLMKNDATFPRGIKIGLGGPSQRATRLDEEAIDEWLRSRQQVEDDGTA